MPFDLIAWADVAPGALAQQPIPDGLINTFLSTIALTGQVLLPRHKWLLGAYGQNEATGEEFRIRQTGLKLDHQFYKYKLNASLDPMYGYTHLFGRPLPLKSNTTIWADTVNAASEDTIVAILVGNGKITQSMLDQVTPDHQIHGVGDQAVVADTWSQVAIVWDQIPDQGRYAICGMLASCHGNAETAVCRLVIPGAQSFRPGVPMSLPGAAHTEVQDLGLQAFRRWPLMREVSFMDTQMPNIEVLANNALTVDHNVSLLIKRIGSV